MASNRIQPPEPHAHPSPGESPLVRRGRGLAGPRFFPLAGLTVALAGCSLGGLRATVPPDTDAAQTAPAAWMATLPHGGDMTTLVRWWSQFDDPMLTRLVAAAQEVNPTITSAESRLMQARAGLASAGAELLPRLDLRDSHQRSRGDLGAAASTTHSLLAAASWEIDVFGAAAAGREAARARMEAAQLGWHEARVLVAAEIASQYVALRACEAQLKLAQSDAQARAEVERLTVLTTSVGFQSPSHLGLARASAAQGRNNVVAQRAACDSVIKLLVELSGLPEGGLRAELSPRTARMPRPAALQVAGVPAQVLQQRPDMARALREVRAAGAELAQAGAQRLPQISLAGTLGLLRVDSGGHSDAGRVWSFGPLQVTLPLFDGGRIQATQDGARARYVEAELLLKARVRLAVREVEDALVQLDSARQRGDDARLAAEGFQASLRGTEGRYKARMATLFELEDARRSALAAQAAQIDLQRQHVASWIALYKALGGGWTPAADDHMAAN